MFLGFGSQTTRASLRSNIAQDTSIAMKSGILHALCLAGSVVADVSFDNWHPPVRGDLRSGCPAMNSMANHGFINRDGRNLTAADVVPRLVEVFHLSTELATLLTQLGLPVFTLGDLNIHNRFEHDASLSRKDFYFGGDGFTLDDAAFNQWFSHFGDGDKEYIDLQTAATARYSRVKHSHVHNPTFVLDAPKRLASYGETILFFRTMVDPRNQQCRRDFVEIFFKEQRIPYREGWRRPTAETTGLSLASDILELALRTPENMGTNDRTVDVPECSLSRPGETGEAGVKGGPDKFQKVLKKLSSGSAGFAEL
ncbi:hypothetical protein MCOR02_004899 [Pyricularia oryzae]|nr:hypothetical protein MCOR02_004899 [Pyricularia oryzae]KAI6291338.1 hypothetical protein MCOR34_010210 [Pyricularia oryzae]KAI6571202.1 hypothetical protein MCOR04_007895 [Pyricularia oryzae]